MGRIIVVEDSGGGPLKPFVSLAEAICPAACAGPCLLYTSSVRVMKDPNASLAAFRSGELDLLNVPLALYSEILSPDGVLKDSYKQYPFREVKLLNLKFLAFNMQKAPWGNDLTLRRRVSDGIDRDAITRQLFRGRARVATSVIPSGIPGFE